MSDGEIDFIGSDDGEIESLGSCDGEVDFLGSCSGVVEFIECEDEETPVTQPEPWLYASWRQGRGSLVFGLTGATDVVEGGGGLSAGGAGSDVGGGSDGTDDTGDDDGDGWHGDDAGSDGSDIGDGGDGSGGADVIDDALRTSFSLWSGAVGRSQGSSLPF